MRTNSSPWLLDCLGLSIFLIVFYMLWLGSFPLFTPDEGRYSEVAREMIVAHDYITPRINGVAFLDKPALYYWLQAIAIKTFGLNEWSLRFFPALFGILGCLSVYLAGRCLFTRRTGILAAVILATSPIYFGAAHYANLDLEVAVLISFSLLLFITAIQKERGRLSLLLGSYFFAGLAILTKGLIGLAFPMLIIGTWIVLLRRFSVIKKMHILPGMMLILIIVLPWYILVQKANPHFFQFFIIDQQIGRFLSKQTFNNRTPFWFYFPIILIGFFPWTFFLFQTLIVHIRNCYREITKNQTHLFLILWIFIIFIFFSIPHSKTIGYILPIFPPLALLVGNFLDTQWKNTSTRLISLAMGSYIFICCLFFLGVFILLQNNRVIIPPGFNPYLAFQAILLLISAIILVFLGRKKNLFPLVLILTLTNILFLLALTKGTVHLNLHSIKPLALPLKAMLHLDDEIITFRKYYQDLPLYMEKRITVVENWQSEWIPIKDNWRREIWYGMRFQDTSKWLIDYKTFASRWNSPQRVYVFTSPDQLPRIRVLTHPDTKYSVIGQHSDIILLTNRPQ